VVIAGGWFLKFAIYSQSYSYFLAKCEITSILNIPYVVSNDGLVLIYYFQEEKDITDVFVYDA